MFTDSQKLIIGRRAKQENVDPLALLALFIVEANSQVFATVHGKQMPLIRWEGHYFDRLVPAKFRELARKKKLASPKVGGIPNPKSQEARYDILRRGKEIDETAAIGSTSYGFGQVMGDHWKKFNLSSARAFEEIAFSGFEGQLDLVIRFLKMSGIIPHIQRKDWTAVARIYNGKQYAKNNYHIKMRDEYAKLLKQSQKHLIGDSPAVPEAPASAGMLRAGSKGPLVRELQTLLRRAGQVVAVDGDFGPSTEDAVRAFQLAAGLEADGVAGPKTMQSLNNFRSVPEEVLTATPVASVDEVKQGGGVGAAVTGLVAIKGELTELASSLTGANVETLQTFANYVTIAAAAVGVAGAAYAVYGYWKAKRNFKGIEDAT